MFSGDGYDAGGQNMVEISGDSFDYDVLTDAAKDIKGVDGVVCEIGLRMGGGLKAIVEGLMAHEDLRPFVAIDPYGSIGYCQNEVWRMDASAYTNSMKNQALQAIGLFCELNGVNFMPFIMEDSEFFSRFGDGVPIYEGQKRIVSRYALTLFDGPHNSQSVLEEIGFFIPRCNVGSYFVFDDVQDYDHSKVHSVLSEDGRFVVVRSTGRKISYKRVRV